MARSGVRRLWALVAGLPPDSATARQGKAWTFRDEIAATAMERQDMWANLHAQIRGAKSHQVPQPVVFVHPDRESEQQQKKKATRSEIERFFGNHAKGR